MNVSLTDLMLVFLVVVVVVVEVLVLVAVQVDMHGFVALDMEDGYFDNLLDTVELIEDIVDLIVNNYVLYLSLDYKMNMNLVVFDLKMNCIHLAMAMAVAQMPLLMVDEYCLHFHD
jgi:hypothetical protein